MDEIGNNISFNANENRPVIDNLRDSNNEIVNRSAENELSTVESAAIFQNSTVTEKQVLTSVNNYCKDVKPNCSFTIADNLTSALSNNSEETGTKTDTVNSFNQVYETPSNIETSTNIPVGEVPVGSVSSLPDALSGKICSDNLMNHRNNVIQCNESSVFKVGNVDSVIIDTEESKDGKNDSYMIVQDLVDFSFKEQVNYSVDLNENFTAVDSVPKHPETSPNTTPDKICRIIEVGDKHEIVTANTSAEYPKTDSVKVLDESVTNRHTDSVLKDSSENCAVIIGNSTNNYSPQVSSVNETSEKKCDSKVINANEVSGFEPFPLDISAGSNSEVVNSEGAAIQLSEVPSSVGPHEFSPLKEGKVSFGKSCEQFSDSDNTINLPENSSKKLAEVSPLGAENITYGVSDKPFKQFSDIAAVGHENHFSEEQVSPLKVGNISFGISDKPLEQFSDIAAEGHDNHFSEEQVSPLKVGNISFGMSDKPLEQFSDIVAEVHDNPFNDEQVSPLKEGNISFGMSDKPLEQFSDSDIVYKVPKNLSSTEQDQVSPLKLENVSLGMSDKPVEHFSDPEIVFKMSENPLSKEILPLEGENLSFNKFAETFEQFSDADIAVKKVPENSNDQNDFSLVKENVSLNLSDKPIQQISDPDFIFKVPEVPINNPLGQLRNPELAFKVPEKSLTAEDDEQFVDAAQFFKDPNSFKFLENIRTSTIQPGPVAPRSSLYVNFDPLHSKLQTNVPRVDNCELISAAIQDRRISAENLEKRSPEAVNKLLVDVATRESMGNILISFDSPKSSTSVDSKIPVETQPCKMFSEEELQQKLKIHYLETQETYLKKQREMETEIAKRDKLLNVQQMVMEEFCGILFKHSEDIKGYKEEVKSLKEENEKLKEDLKTSAEDVQNVENTFTDFYKRYDQCKGMLKTYKDNEEHLKQTILDLQDKAKEQEEMYNMLQKRTEEMLEKANVEVDIAKRSGEAQVTVLKAQLKKAEMKISSLESDNKQIKMENSQLGGICDDLMAKVSQS